MSLSKVNEDPVVQENYLREITQHYRSLSKPLKYGPKINSLKDLINALYGAFGTNYVNIELVNHIMLSYESNPKEWEMYAKFDSDKYTRNLVDAGNGKFNLIILCWNKGQGSAIHDHANSHCFMKMLKGELKEIRYEWPNTALSNNNEYIGHVDIGHNVDDNKEITGETELKEMGTTSINLNDVAYINDNIGLHRVENPSKVDTAVSLHLYCPPFDKCSVFQKKSGTRMTCPVTFYSKYGKTEL